MLHSEFKSLVKEVVAQGVPWVQGSGGNLSYKEGSQLFIKPSGHRIEDLLDLDVAAVVDFTKFRQGFSTLVAKATEQDSAQNELGYSDLIKGCQLTPHLRPSMETGFHAVLPHRYVFHVHSVWMVCLSDLLQTEKLSEFKEWYDFQWKKHLGEFCLIPLVQPGFELSHQIAKDPLAQVYILSQHGVVIQFSAPAYLQTYVAFEKAVVEKFFSDVPSDIVNDVYQWQNSTRFEQGTLKFTSPDIVVMAERFRKQLISTPNGKMQFISKTTDKDAFENWLSLQMILQIRPTIGELPVQQQQELLQLPSEVERMRIMNLERKKSP